MNLFSKDPSEMTLDQMFAELAWSDPGELTRWNLETRDLPGMIFTCCEELDDLAEKMEVVGWCQTLHNEAVEDMFYNGLYHIAEDIQHRIKIVEAIIRKATVEMRKELEAP